MILLDISRLVLAGSTLALLAAVALPRLVPVAIKKLSLLSYASVLVVCVVARLGWLDSVSIGIMGSVDRKLSNGVQVSSPLSRFKADTDDDIDVDADPVEFVLFATTFAWLLLLLASQFFPIRAPLKRL
jgi:hypothetical protein